MVKHYSKKEYQSIADIYNLGQVEKFVRLYRGHGGSAKVKLVTSEGEFIVSKNIISKKKDLISKSKDSLQCEIDLLNTVKGLPVPYFRISINKNYIEKFKEAFVTVYDYIPGKAPVKITPNMAYQLGEFLGEFHVRSKKFNKNIWSRRKFYDLNPAVMRKMKPVVQKQTNSMLKLITPEIEQGVIVNRPQSKFPSGPIHVDIGHNNELFVKNTLSGIIDFGNFYNGPFMIDVGKTIMWNCCVKGVLDMKLLNKFIDGYTSKRKLNKSENAYITKSILYAIYSHIWVDLYHVPIKYVPKSWLLFLVKTFLPVARGLEKSKL